VTVAKADLHIHTARGDGMADLPEILAYVEGETDLAAIAITEHDDLSAAHEARDLWAKGSYRFALVVGMEVTTLEGHLLALFLEEPAPSLKPLLPTLEEVHRLGGLCIIPHPMSWLTRSIGQRTIERVLREGSGGAYFDGIETANMSPGARRTIKKARRLNGERYHLAEVGGSDAHFLTVIGSSYTLYEGSSAEDLREAILQKRTTAANGRYPGISQIGIGQVMRQTWRGVTATPRKMGWRRTIWSFFRRVRP
jgi:predicted metal-dependent phosphoesterase TrpH